MWSLCRWVSSSAVSLLAPDPDGGGALQHAATTVHEEGLAARAHRASTVPPDAGSGMGLPVPSRVTSIMGSPNSRNRASGVRTITDAAAICR